MAWLERFSRGFGKTVKYLFRECAKFAALRFNLYLQLSRRCRVCSPNNLLAPISCTDNSCRHRKDHSSGTANRSSNHRSCTVNSARITIIKLFSLTDCLIHSLTHPHAHTHPLTETNDLRWVWMVASLASKSRSDKFSWDQSMVLWSIGTVWKLKHTHIHKFMPLSVKLLRNSEAFQTCVHSNIKVHTESEESDEKYF